MITGGIDVGLESIKAVILKDGKVVARGTVLSGGAGRASSADKVWEAVLKTAGLNASDVSGVVATGQGKYDVSFADSRVVEPVADARAGRFLYSPATAVVDIGADQTRVVILGNGDSILEVILNQKCAAGLGIFLEYMARRLEMTLDEMSHVPLDGDNDIAVNDGCTVFAELDALSLLNRNYPRQDVARAITEAVAVRVNSVLNDKVRPAKDSTVLIGGVSRNKAVISALKKRSGVEFIIPEHPEYAGALGAALIAAG